MQMKTRTYDKVDSIYRFACIFARPGDYLYVSRNNWGIILTVRHPESINALRSCRPTSFPSNLRVWGFGTCITSYLNLSWMFSGTRICCVCQRIYTACCTHRSCLTHPPTPASLLSTTSDKWSSRNSFQNEILQQTMISTAKLCKEMEARQCGLLP